MKKGLLFIVVLLFAFGAQLKAQTVIASVDTNQILIGEQFTLTIVVDDPNGEMGNWPIAGDTINKFEIISAGPVDSNNAQLRQEVVLTIFDSGAYVIEPIPFVFEDKEVLTEPISIQVNTIIVDMEGDITDIKAPIQAPFNIWDYWLVISILMGIAIIISTVIFVLSWITSMEEEKVIVPPKPKVPPFDKAIIALNSIEEERAWDTEKPKQYYSRLIDVIREFLEEEYQIPAMEFTTDETVSATKTLKITEAEREDLKQLFTQADLVKFAKAKPTVAEGEMYVKYAHRILLALKPRAVEKEGQK